MSESAQISKSILRLVDFITGSSLSFRVIALVLIFIIHIVLVLQHQDFDYLASYGGLITVISFVFIFGYSFPREEPLAVMPDKPKIVRKKSYCSITLDGHSLAEVIPSDIADKIEKAYDQKIEQHHGYLRKKRSHLSASFYLTIFGTTTWAYAGYLTEICFNK